jgi:hypothetical protein
VHCSIAHLRRTTNWSQSTRVLFAVASKFPVQGSVGTLEHIIKQLDGQRIEIKVLGGDRTVLIGGVALEFDCIVETDIKVATIGTDVKATTAAGAYTYEGYLTVS